MCLTTSMPTSPTRSATEPAAPRAVPSHLRPRRARSGLSPSRRELADRYVPMARTLAKRYKLRCPDLWEDFDSAALLALVEAAETFDPERGVKFGTFARRRVLGALVDVLRSKSARTRPVRRGILPEAVLTDRPALLETAGGRVVGIEAEPPVGSEFERHDFLERLIAALPPAEADACRRLYLLGQSQTEAAEELGVSQARLSQLHRNALARLRLYAVVRLGDGAAA